MGKVSKTTVQSRTVIKPLKTVVIISVIKILRQEKCITYLRNAIISMYNVQDFFPTLINRSSNIRATLFTAFIITSKLGNMEMQGTIDHKFFIYVDGDRFLHTFLKVEGRILKPVLSSQQSHSFIHNFEMCEFETSIPLRSYTCYHNHS